MDDVIILDAIPDVSDDEAVVATSTSSAVGGGGNQTLSVIASVSCESFHSAVANLDSPVSPQATTDDDRQRSRSRSPASPPRANPRSLPSVIRRRYSSGGSPSRPIETSPLPPIPSDDPVDRAIAEIRRFPTIPAGYLLEAMKFGSSEETADRFLEFVKRMPKDNKQVARNRINAIMRLLENDDVANSRFTNGFIDNNPFERCGRINALARLGFCRVTPYIIVDALIHKKTDTHEMRSVVNRIKADYPDKLDEILLFLLDNKDNPGSVHDKLRCFELFANLTAQQVASSIRANDVRKFVIHILDLANIPMSLEVKKRMVNFDVDRFVVLHYRQEVELRDFYNYIMELVAGDRDALLPVVLDFLDEKYPAASSYIAKRENLPPRAVEAAAEPHQCKNNDVFHNYRVGNEIVIESASHLSALYSGLDSSPDGIVIDVYIAMPSLTLLTNVIGLVTFSFRNATVFYMPRVAPELAARIGNALREADPLVVAFRYDQWGVSFEQLFSWKPRQIAKIEDLASSGGVQPNINAIAHYLTQGPFCRRASGISSTATPSSEALFHFALKSAMFWKCYRVFSPASSVDNRRAVPGRREDDNQRRLATERGQGRTSDRSRSDNRDSSRQEHRHSSPPHGRERRHDDVQRHDRHREDRDRRRENPRHEDRRHENRGNSSRNRDDRHGRSPPRDRDHGSSSGYRRR